MQPRATIAAVVALLLAAGGIGTVTVLAPLLAARPPPDTAASRATDCATVADIATHRPDDPFGPDVMFSPYLVGHVDLDLEARRSGVTPGDRWLLKWLLARSQATALQTRPDLDCRRAFLAAGMRLDPGAAERTRLTAQFRKPTVIVWYSRPDRLLNAAMVTEVIKSCRYLPVISHSAPKHFMREGGYSDTDNLALARSGEGWQPIGGIPDKAILVIRWLDACQAAPTPHTPVIS